MPGYQKHIGKICKIYLSSGERAYGMTIQQSGSGILIQQTIDFHTDGMQYYPWDSIDRILYGKAEKSFENMYHQYGISHTSPVSLEIIDMFQIMNQLTKRLLMIEKINGKNLFGQVIEIQKSFCLIRCFDVYGKRANTSKILYSQIFSISFDNEYLRVFEKSMKL